MKKKINIKNAIIFIPIIILMIISFLNMANAAIISSQYTNHLTRQIIWYGIGIIIVIAFLFIKPELIFKYSFWFYIINVSLLIFVLIFGKTINGSKAWFDLGIFSYQPSETMKLALLLYLIDFSIKHQNIKGFWLELKYILQIIIITLVPAMLTFLEPDTGAIIIYFIIALVILLNSKINKLWFIFFFCIFLIACTSFFILFFKYQDTFVNIFGTSFFYRLDRLVDFQNGSGMQLENAIIAMSVSSTFGNGIKNYTLYFPEAPTDFIFALTITNFGFIGGIIVILTCLVLDVIILTIAFKNNNTKTKLLALTLFSILAFQQIQNIFMNIGLTPIIGIPLPFLSYGGTNLIVFFVILAILFKMLITKEKYPLRVF